MSHQINELERQLSDARTRIAGLEIERDGAYSLLREAADENAALQATLDSLRTAPADPVSEEPCNYGAHFAGCKHEIAENAPTAPVMLTMWAAGWCANPDCKCLAFTPAPPPTTPREELADAWPCDCGGTVTPEVWLRCSNGRCGNPSQRPAPAGERGEP